MKKILLSAIALLSLTAATAQVYSASDSTAFSAWTSVDLDGDGFEFAAAEVNGMSCVSYSYDNAGPAALTPNNIFISPVIDLTTSTNSMLNFDVTAIDQGWLAENYAVYVVTDLAAITTGTFPTAVQEETISETGVLTKNINISAIADGQSSIYVVLRHFNCTDNFGVGFTNFSVSGDLASVENEGSLEVLSAYPNPTTDVLNITLNENVSTVSILSLDGKVISTENVNANTASLNVSNLSTGIYFYEVITTEGNRLRNKFVKK